CKHYYSTPLTF
nr:immunoglobulin light chain junction region [Macaca mulatta]